MGKPIKKYIPKSRKQMTTTQKDRRKIKRKKVGEK